MNDFRLRASDSGRSRKKGEKGVGCIFYPQKMHPTPFSEPETLHRSSK
jgi:hypothetical protein